MKSRRPISHVNPGGLPIAFAGGIGADATLVREQRVVSENVVRAVSGRRCGRGRRRARGRGHGHDPRHPDRPHSVVAEAAGGALAQGGGIANVGQLTLERTLVLATTSRDRCRRPVLRLPLGGQGRRDLERQLRRRVHGGADADAQRRARQQPQRTGWVREPGRRALHPLPGHEDGNADRGKQARPVLRLLNADEPAGRTRQR